jgi:hypothetical protein
MSPEQLQAIQAAWGDTAGLAGQYAGYMQDQLPGLTGAPQFSTSLPTDSFDIGDRFEGLNATIAAANDPVMRALQEQILPGIKSSALDAGAYSGDRAMSVLPTQAIGNAVESMSRNADQLAYQDYQDFENRRLAAFQSDQDRMLAAYGADTQRGLGVADNNNAQLSLLPQYIQSMLHTSGSVGDLLQMSAALGTGNQQQQINDQVARDKYASYAPFMGLDTASQLLSALSGNWGTQTSAGEQTTKNTQSGGMLGELLKAGLGIASAAMGMPGGLAGAGAMAGGMSPSLGLLASDIFQPIPFSNIAGGLQGAVGP